MCRAMSWRLWSRVYRCINERTKPNSIRERQALIAPEGGRVRRILCDISAVYIRHYCRAYMIFIVRCKYVRRRRSRPRRADDEA